MLRGTSRAAASFTAAVSLAATAALAVVPTAAQAKTAAPVITISGATGSAPLVALLATKYVQLNPGKVKFKIAQGGGEVGVQDVAASRVTIGDASRDPLPSDPAGLVFHPIARDFFAFDTNPANPLPNLTTAQATAIWTGQVRDWSQVAGSTITGPIDLIGRTAASSLPPLVSKIFLGGKTVSPLAALKPSDGLVEQSVATDKNAIGYNSGWYASQKNVHAVPFNGVAPSAQTVKSGQFPGQRTYYEVTKGAATGASAKFIAWIGKSKAAKKIINSHWVPLGG